MRYVVCYDIADNGRRGRVVQVLLDFGRRIQESVFVLDLDAELAERMRERLSHCLEVSEDTVHVFRLCGTCLEKTEVFGRAELPVDQQYYVL